MTEVCSVQKHIVNGALSQLVIDYPICIEHFRQYPEVIDDLFCFCTRMTHNLYIRNVKIWPGNSLLVGPFTGYFTHYFSLPRFSFVYKVINEHSGYNHNNNEKSHDHPFKEKSVALVK